MAVFTKISATEIAPWLEKNYALHLEGEPLPITAGIENTNYRIRANSTDYIFTIVEMWDWQMASYCVGLARHISIAKLPVPQPQINVHDTICTEFAGKPVVLTVFVNGSAHLQPNVNDCATFGDLIARLQLAAADYRGNLPNARARKWRVTTAAMLRDNLVTADQQLLDTALQLDETACAADLPQTACHCDLFRNNVLWHDGDIAGVIDFFFAGTERLTFDLAVACNDWCMDDKGVLDEQRLRALVGAYSQVRPLSATERQHLPAMLASAALRFWLSRLLDEQSPRPAVALVAHNPQAFRHRLHSVIQHTELLASL